MQQIKAAPGYDGLKIATLSNLVVSLYTIAVLGPLCVCEVTLFLVVFLIVTLSRFFSFSLEICLKLQRSQAMFIVQKHNRPHCPLQLDGG